MVLYAITQGLIIEKILLILTSRNLEKVQFRLASLHKFDRYCESNFKCVGIEFRFRSTSTASNSFCIYIYLTINKGQCSDFKGAHGIQQWWILILPVKLSIYVLSVQPALNEAAKSVNRPKRLPNTAAQVCGRMSLGKAFVWPKLGKSCITTQSILILFFLWSILCLLEIEGRIQINMFWTT